MNAAGTMPRVYQAVKARVIAGSFAPGDRIDPARLAPELAASVTPIRDALYRLVGERLVENWQQEGFRQPLITEAALRDLYAWSDDLLQLILRHPLPDARIDPGLDLDTDDHATTVARVFDDLAGLSGNHEHRLAIVSLNDRSHAVRGHEPRVIANALAPLHELVDAVRQARWVEARRLSRQYHAARQRVVPRLAGLMRPRDS